MSRRALLLCYLAWVVCWIGALTSVYFGEVLMFEPCNLCWYQRMALFPLIILLGGALYQKDRSVIYYAITFAAIGDLIAWYQVINARFFHGHIDILCGSNCGVAETALFGWLPLSLFSAIGFGIILLLLWVAARE